MTDRTNIPPPEISDPTSLPQLARHLFASALADCRIERSLTASVRVENRVDGTRALRLDHDELLDLTRCQHVRVLAIGKAAATMLEAALPLLAGLNDLQGILVAPSPPAFLPDGFHFFAGGHPLPNEASFAAARATLQMLSAVSISDTAETLCLFLISGGASAMMELPLDAAIPLDDTRAFHRALVHSGASIAEINCVRKHFSAVKGGRLAVATGGAACVSLFVSDVPAAHLDALGSGPTLPDPTTLDDCRAVLSRYDLLQRFPASVQRFFRDPALPETPKPGEFVPRTLTLLSADHLAEAARCHAKELGFHAVVDNTCDDWDARAAADYLLARLRVLRRIYPRVCLISAGEVTLSAADPRVLANEIGGRNQHFALYAATRLEASDAPLAVLSAGSDGIDGNSSFAGAVVDHRTVGNPQLRSEAQAALLQFRSTALLERVGATLHTGPTGNNLRDLRILLAG